MALLGWVVNSSANIHSMPHTTCEHCCKCLANENKPLNGLVSHPGPNSQRWDYYETCHCAEFTDHQLLSLDQRRVSSHVCSRGKSPRRIPPNGRGTEPPSSVFDRSTKLMSIPQATSRQPTLCTSHTVPHYCRTHSKISLTNF